MQPICQDVHVDSTGMKAPCMETAKKVKKIMAWTNLLMHMNPSPHVISVAVNSYLIQFSLLKKTLLVAWSTNTFGTTVTLEA